MAETSETFQISAEQAEIYESAFVPAIFAQWSPMLLDAVGAEPGQRVLDVACGTGVLARTAADRVGPTGKVVGVDLSEGMLSVARRLRPDIAWQRGDATDLPLADADFDVTVCQSALMFMPDATAALREMARVTRPGGRLVVCEFSRPVNGALRTIYLDGFMRALPRIASLTASAADAYVYLAESILAWPDQAGLAEMIAGAGWQQPEWRNLTGGIVALHRATA